MNPNGVKVTGERLTQNSRPGFFLGYGEALTCALARVDRLPHTIYTNQNHKYHAENLIFYSIEQKGLFTDNGRRTPPPQSAPMGSRLASLLLSVKACGSGQRAAASLGAYSPIYIRIKMAKITREEQKRAKYFSTSKKF